MITLFGFILIVIGCGKEADVSSPDFEKICKEQNPEHSLTDFPAIYSFDVSEDCLKNNCPENLVSFRDNISMRYEMVAEDNFDMVYINFFQNENRISIPKYAFLTYKSINSNPVQNMVGLWVRYIDENNVYVQTPGLNNYYYYDGLTWNNFKVWDLVKKYFSETTKEQPITLGVYEKDIKNGYIELVVPYSNQYNNDCNLSFIFDLDRTKLINIKKWRPPLP